MDLIEREINEAQLTAMNGVYFNSYKTKIYNIELNDEVYIITTETGELTVPANSDISYNEYEDEYILSSDVVELSITILT